MKREKYPVIIPIGIISFAILLCLLLFARAEGWIQLPLNILLSADS